MEELKLLDDKINLGIVGGSIKQPMTAIFKGILKILQILVERGEESNG